MRRLFLLVVITSLLAAVLGGVWPAKIERAEAQVLSIACQNFSGIVSGVYSDAFYDGNGALGTANPGEVFTITITLGTAPDVLWAIVNAPLGMVLSGPSNTPGTLTYVVPDSGLPPGSQGVGFDAFFNGTIAVSASCGLATAAGNSIGGIRDGRLCHWDQYAVYTTGEIIDVYGINDRKGFFVLRVTQDELDAAPGAADVNTLVKSSSDGLVQVYRLGDTETLQVHAGLDFVRFTGLPASGVVCGNIDLD